MLSTRVSKNAQAMVSTFCSQDLIRQVSKIAQMSDASQDLMRHHVSKYAPVSDVFQLFRVKNGCVMLLKRFVVFLKLLQ